MKSMNEKITQAFNLANLLADRLNDGTLKADEDTQNMIYGHADGLSAKRLYNLRDGRCSLAATLAFDPEKEEAELDRAIGLMTKLKS